MAAVSSGTYDIVDSDEVAEEMRRIESAIHQRHVMRSQEHVSSSSSQKLQRLDDGSSMDPVKTTFLAFIGRLLEAKGSKETMDILADTLKSVRLVQAITGTGAAASFFHANTYSDTRGEGFGVLTALSCVLALVALIVTSTLTWTIAFVEPEDTTAVRGFMRRFWSAIFSLLAATVLSMLLFVSSIVVVCFQAYSAPSAIAVCVVACMGLLATLIYPAMNTGKAQDVLPSLVLEPSDQSSYERLSIEEKEGLSREVSLLAAHPLRHC